MSIADRISAFYRANPHEELTYTDLVIKFGCSLKRARKCVYQLQEAGLIESVHVVRARLPKDIMEKVSNG